MKFFKKLKSVNKFSSNNNTNPDIMDRDRTDNMSGQPDASFADTIPSNSFNSNIMSNLTAEKVQKKIWALENEVVALKRDKALLIKEFELFKNYDEKEAFVAMTEKYDRERILREQAENKLAEVSKKFYDFQESTAQQFSERDAMTQKLREKSRELEKENEMLKEQSDNDKSMLHKLKEEQSVQQEFFSVKNSQPEKCSTITQTSDDLFTDPNLVDKHRQQIKEVNKQLEQEYRGKNPAFDRCIQQLDDDSMAQNEFTQYTQDSAILETSKAVDDVEPSEPHPALTVDEYATMIIRKASSLSEVCVQLFERLQGTAEFFHRTLEMLGADDAELFQKIGDFKIDLDKSLCEAKSIYMEAKNAEKSFRCFMEKSANTSAVFNLSFVNSINESQPEETAEVPISKPVMKCQFCDNLKQTLNNELSNKDVLLKRITELEDEKAKFQEQNLNEARNKENLVSGIREELGKICDTLAYTSDKYGSIMKKGSRSSHK